MQDCFCGNSTEFKKCCKPLIDGEKKALSAEQLMRSRYSAYCSQAADYLLKTTYHTTRKFHNKADILAWSNSNIWKKLEIIKASETTVEFKAFYSDDSGYEHCHHEKSTFISEDGSWFYVDGVFF